MRIAVLMSGGDAPAMNAALRGITRYALNRHAEVLGVRDGFYGLLSGQFLPLSHVDVRGLGELGGAWLGSARDPRMKCAIYQTEAAERLRENAVDCLIVIGGNGSQQGSLALDRLGAHVIGIASTIDNDLAEFETTLGVDTAINAAARAIDDLKRTATSHRRAFVVEVMGRTSGYLATHAALAAGADLALVPEAPVEAWDVLATVRRAFAAGERHAIIVVAEGYPVPSIEVMRRLKRNAIDARQVVLGHLQRGGEPTAADRILATHMATEAVEAALAGEHGFVLGPSRGDIVRVQFYAATRPCVKVTLEDVALVRALA
jgi:6-phosphofructokinase 1